MVRFRSPGYLVLLLSVGVLLVVGFRFWWMAARDPQINFLARHAPAKWIIYATPPDTAMHPTIALSAEFRRSFVVSDIPASATLSLQGFKRCALQLNGHPVAVPVPGERTWKQPIELEISDRLRRGENRIVITVTNDNGPPALWAVLRAGDFTLATDEHWEVSQAGAVWERAALAEAPRAIRPGSLLYGRERTIDALGQVWPVWALFGVVSGLLALAIVRLWREGELRASRFLSSGSAYTAMVVASLAVLWGALFWNNLPQLPRVFGFDAEGHLQYIEYIQKHNALPLANEGWQMYQPPLYYALSALTLNLVGLSAWDEGATLLLRALNGVIGIAHVAVLFLCLRLLFPDQRGKQLIGLVMGGFLPAHLYVSHYVTNEGLAAALGTATLYFALKIFRADKPSVRLHLALGACLGAALLAKFSAVLVAVVVVGTLTVRALVNLRQAPAAESRASMNRARPLWHLCAAVLVCLAVCGWHYARVWWQFGTPLVGNWDAVSRFGWWQEDGYRTAAYFWRFGAALATPGYSSFAGFADGLYSTLWGDGLWSSGARFGFRPPWNYDLMTAGYLLSAVPMALIVVGAAVAFVRLIRRPTAEWFILIGLAAAFLLGIVFMSLKVASHAQVKAFYALSALLPLCAFAAVGWEAVSRFGRMARRPVLMVLAVWAMGAYASFWIRGGSPATHIVAGLNLADQGRHEAAAAEFSKALELDEVNSRARTGLATAYAELGRLDEARRHAKQAVADNPGDADAYLQLAVILAKVGQTEQAVELAAKAIKLAPDFALAHQWRAIWLSRTGRTEELLEACRSGLGLTPFSAELHYLLGSALLAGEDSASAVSHLRLALRLRPHWREAQKQLGIALAMREEFQEAAECFTLALQLQPEDAAAHSHLAMVYERLGRIREAAAGYEAVLRLQPDTPIALNNLAWIRATHPDPQLRNGTEAVRLAERACELTQFKEPMLIGTLAAAYAEAGQFEEAVNAAQKARELALAAGLEQVAEKNRELTEWFKARKAYREPR